MYALISCVTSASLCSSQLATNMTGCRRRSHTCFPCTAVLLVAPASPEGLTLSIRRQVDAGVADQLVLGDPKAPRFVLWNGELLPTPSGPDVLTFRLLSLWGKIRAGLGAIGIKKPLPGAD